MMKTILNKAYRVFEHTYLHVLFHAGAYQHITHYGDTAVVVSSFLSFAVIAFNVAAIITEAEA